jgi:hypothetical protein
VEVLAIANIATGIGHASHSAGDESMLTKEGTEMSVAWGRALIGIGVIVAFLTLGALEILTARLPASEPVAGQVSPDNEAAEPWQDFLDVRPQFAGRDPGATSVNERTETDSAVVAAESSALLR